jgi:hypothetical protein
MISSPDESWKTKSATNALTDLKPGIESLRHQMNPDQDRKKKKHIVFETSANTRHYILAEGAS